MREIVRKVVRWFGGREPVVLLGLLIVVVGVWSFIEIADEVFEGETQALDVRVLKALRKPDKPAEPIGPAWLAEVGRDVTALGGVAVLAFFTAAVAGFLCLMRKYRMLVVLLIATGSGLLLSSVLKQMFHRPRPDVVPHLSYIYTTSFPSGHSMMSAIVYLTLGTLLAAVLPRRSLKVYVLTLSILLTVAVGISRVYMGVHYPTDVLAGWAAGLTWAILCWLATRWLQQTGQVEN